MRSLSLALLLISGTAFADRPKPAFDFYKLKPLKQAEARVYDHMELDDMIALGQVLRQQVAYIEVEVDLGPGEEAMDETRDGFGIPVRENQIAVMSFIVDKAKKVTVRGPKDGLLQAKVILSDVVRRVAILETTGPVTKVGLTVPKRAMQADLQEAQSVFALQSTRGEPVATAGWLLSKGQEHLYDGLPQTSLILSYGMPVFDKQARFVGYARTVHWDVEKRLIVPPEIITEARTATAAAPADAEPKHQHPWWAK